MRSDNTSTNDEELSAKGNVTISKEHSKMSRLKMNRLASGKKKKYLPSTGGSSVFGTASRHSDRNQDTSDLDGNGDSFYSIAYSSFDLTSICEDDYLYEESHIKSDNFTNTYLDIVAHKRNKAWTNQTKPSILDKEIELFQGITNDMPYELSQFSTNITTENVAKIKKLVENLKLSTSLCIFTYLYSYSNVHLRGHFPRVYAYRRPMEPTHYPLENKDGISSEPITMDGKYFAASHLTLMSDDSENGSRRSSSVALSEDPRALQRTKGDVHPKNFSRSKPKKNLSELYQKCIKDKYVFRFGLKNTSVFFKYAYDNLKPYYPPNMSSNQQFKIELIYLRGIHFEEPYFASIFFIDVKMKQKLCEDFLFDFNDKETTDLLEDLMEVYDEKNPKYRINQCKSVILNSNFSSPDDIYMVLRVKTLKRSVKKNEYRSIYNTSNKKKNKRNKEDIIVRLLQRPLLTSSMGWYAYSLKKCIQCDKDLKNEFNENQSSAKDTSKLHLFKVDNPIDKQDIPSILSSNEIFEDKQDRFSDEDLIDLIVEYHRNGYFKKLNTLAVEFKFSITKFSPTDNYNIIPNCKTLDKLNKNANQVLPLAISLLELHLTNHMMPIKTYQNVAILDLKMLNLINQKFFPSKFVVCKLEMIDGANQKPIKCFYNRFNRLKLHSEYYSELHTSSKLIYFKESIKVELPLDPHPKTHFLVNFYGVSFEKNHDERLQKHLQTWLPLFNENVLNVGRHSLPLASGELSSGYDSVLPTSTTSLSCAEWIDNQKPLFVIKLISYSALMPSNKYVGDILEGDPLLYFDETGNCVYFKNMLCNYSEKSHINIISSLYPLINKTMSYFFMDENEIVSVFHRITNNKFSQDKSELYSNQRIYQTFLDNVFLTLIALMNAIFLQLEPFNDLNGRSPILGIYSNYMFNPMHLIDFNMKDFLASLEKTQHSSSNTTKKCYSSKIKNAIENFTKCWTKLKPRVFERSARFSWFLLEIISKMLLFLYETTSIDSRITAADGKTVKIRDPNDPSSKVVFTEDFYRHLVRLAIRLGQNAFSSLSNDKNLHDTIGSSLTHFIIEILQSINPYIVRIMIKVFFDEIVVVEDAQINQMIAEYKLNILNILMADERISEIDVFLLAAQPKYQIYNDENFLVNFLNKSTPILNTFLVEVTHSLRKEPELAKKTFDLIFCYVLNLCEGKTPIKSGAIDGKLWEKLLPQIISNPKNKQQINKSSSTKRNYSMSFCGQFYKLTVLADRSTMHTYVSLSLYPIMLFIIEFFSKEYRYQAVSAAISKRDSIDFCCEQTFGGFSCDTVKALVLRNVSNYGNTFMTNLCLLFIWILNNFDQAYLLKCLNEWNASKSVEFGVMLYSCLLVFQVVKSERLETKSTFKSNDKHGVSLQDSQIIKSTDLRDGSLTKSNALALLKTRRLKKYKTTMWSSVNDNDGNDDHKTSTKPPILYKKDDIIAECTCFLIHIIDFTLNASITSKIKNEELVHKCLIVLIQTLHCREPVAIKVDVIYLLNKFFALVPSWLFGKDYSIISELFKALIELFCSTNEEICQRAIEFCFDVFLLNQSSHQNIDATSDIMHFVVSSVNLNDNTSFENVFQSMSTLKSLPTVEKFQLSQSFKNQFESCIRFSLVILTNRSKVNYLEKYGCTISVIQTLCDIIEQCYESVDLRLYWLYTLLQIVTLDEGFSNAAMCSLHIVVSCFEQLKINGNIEQLKSIEWTYFKVLSENFGLEVATTPRDTIIYNPTLKNFTLKKLIKLMQQAANYLKQSRSTLLAYKAYSLMSDLCFRFGFYDEILSVSPETNDCLKSICDGDYGSSTYFRIGFFGEPFDSICNYPEYILHYTRIISLSELCSILVEHWSRMLSGKKLNIINAAHDVDKKELKGDECYIQVTAVEPFYETSYLEVKDEFEKRYNISKFFYNTPYVMEGSKHILKSSSTEVSLKNQSSRVTIISTRYSVPYISPLIPILNKEHNFLTPIEVSIADLKKRSDDLLTICAMNNPNMVLLEGLLQGCVSTSVNQGPLAIAQTFLESRSQNTKKIQDSDKIKLTNIFKILLKNSKKALETFRTYSDPSRIGLCDHMESNYLQLQSELLKYFC